MSLSLRAMEPEDLDLIYQIENNPAYWQWGTTSVPYSRYALRQYLSENRCDIFTDGQVRLVADEGGKGIGLADLTSFDPIHLRAEIGICLLPEWQGRHLSGLVLDTLVAYARRIHLHQVYAVVAVTNIPASRLFRSSNFQPSSTLSQWIYQNDGTFADAVVWQKLL